MPEKKKQCVLVAEWGPLLRCRGIKPGFLVSKYGLYINMCKCCGKKVDEAVNGATVGEAIIMAWEKLNLLRHAVKLLFVDNAGYRAKSFREHLACFFKNAKLRTCWGHSEPRGLAETGESSESEIGNIVFIDL